MPLAAINVGLRQRGRAAGANVVFCDADPASIEQAIAQVDNPAFKAGVRNMTNPYGAGQSCAAALKFVLESDFAQWQAKIEDPIALLGGAAKGAAHGT